VRSQILIEVTSTGSAADEVTFVEPGGHGKVLAGLAEGRSTVLR
jgi:hypothetical protein